MRKSVIAGGIVAAVIIAIAAVSLSVNHSQSGPNVASQNVASNTVDLSMGSPIQGSGSAPVTIVEFGDYQCDKCDAWFKTVRPTIEDNYINTGKANLVFVDLAHIGPDSIKAAEASYCAEDQNKYWDYHNALYTNQGPENGGWATVANLKTFASQIGLDMNQFNSCLDSDKYQNRVAHNLQVSKDHSLEGTPNFIIMNTKGDQKTIVGPQPYSVFQQTIDAMS